MSIYKHTANSPNEDGLVMKGYQKKLKTMKKKYFALFREAGGNVARLEYFDNERKLKTGHQPKRVIKLKNCFSINRRLDTRHEFVIALSTKDGAFGIVFENEIEMLKWLEALVSLQRSETNSSDETHPQFEQCWPVTVERRGLAEEKGLVGHYYVGLTSTSLTFIRIGPEKTALGETRLPKVEFQLSSIRRCGDSQCYFYIEVGRKSAIGPGEFWMQTGEAMTAENMHTTILSAMSAKSEAMEPMRKRSASATEASKPINVLHRRQNQTENKLNNSPQTGYGRERCDSLPSRNRTTSETSTSQIMSAASTLSVRNYNISGLRSHSYQRHSNSPPMNTTIGCSESEESSVSIDEPDDTGSFMSFRFNSRSSGGVIPEENDELMGVDSHSGTPKENVITEMKSESVTSTTSNNDESYLSMAPVNAFKENTFEKKFEEVRFVPSNVNSVRGAPTSMVQFLEYTSDKVSKNITNDADSQFERPTRAYSIGSKAEHNKFNKRPGNLNECDQNTTRVRAFSVGSRAKIPRCDLQRSVIYPKSLMEHNCNSNNNVCSFNDTCLPNHLLNTTASSEKKSTSAPLLIHKSDRMGDLMEIDFSKAPNNTNNRIYSSTKTPSFKNAISNREQVIRPTTKKEEETKTLDPLIETAISQTDNGYLEMKPVGDSLSKSLPSKHFKDSNNLYSATNVTVSNTPKKSSLMIVPENKNQYTTHILQPVLFHKSEILGTPIIIQDRQSMTDPIQKDKPEKQIRKQTSTAEYINNRLSSVAKPQNNLNILSNKYAQITADSNPKQKTENCSNKDYINTIRKSNEEMSAKMKNLSLSSANERQDRENVKLTHSISDEDNKYDGCGRKAVQSNSETGYEILQIKSDSSLQSHKSINRHNANRKDKQHCPQQTPSRPRSTNSSALSSASSLCGCTSSSTSCLNNLSTPNNLNTIQKGDSNNLQQTCKINNTSNNTSINTNITSTATTTSPLNVTSRPPSVSSEHDLYYASLDLPPTSSGEITGKVNKMEISNGSSPVADVVSTNNLYAKIDFDVSDSSSSSSKNVNN